MTLIADRPAWRAFRRSPTAMIGLTLVALVVLAALLADWIAPYPSHAGPVGDFAAMTAEPSRRFLLGTDTIGRDLLTRLLYAYRLSLEMAAVVLAIATPIGVVVGLLAGYLGAAWSYGLMRLTDVFLSIPPLVLAMSITGFLEPSAVHGMIAITAMWWPWYARLAYNLTRASMVETYRKPFIEMAQAYGFRESRIANRYAFRPALVPVLTILGLDIAALLGNAFLVESVFGWPGLSHYGVEVILHKDLDAIVGTVLIIATAFLVANIAVDLLVAAVNPRIRLAGERS